MLGELIEYDQDHLAVQEIAEKMLSFHTDGTVIATAEVLQVDLHTLWNHFVQHLNPTVSSACSDPTVLAYLYIKCFEDWCMDQLSDSYSAEDTDA